MDWISGFDSLLVVRFAALRWKFLMLGAIKLVESTSHVVAAYKLFFFYERLEEASSDDLKTFFCARGTPRGFNTSNSVPQPIECRASALSADFHVFGDCVRRACGIGGWQADYK